MGSATEKSILFLSLQLKIKLPFEMKISPYNSSLECVTFILFFLRNLSATINLSFSGGKTQIFSVLVRFSILFAPKALDYKCGLQSNLAGEFAYILQC